MKEIRNRARVELGILTSLPFEYGMGFTVLEEPKPSGSRWVVSVLGRTNKETVVEFESKPRQGERFVVISVANSERGSFSYRVVRSRWLEETAEEIEAEIGRALGNTKCT